MTNKRTIRKDKRSREQNGGRFEQGGAALEGLVAHRGTADYLRKCTVRSMRAAWADPLERAFIDLNRSGSHPFSDLEIAVRMRFSQRKRTRKAILLGFL